MPITQRREWATSVLDQLEKTAPNVTRVIFLAGEADRQVCGQIQAYMGWVKETLAKGRKVRGIIVASDFTDRAIYAARVVPDLYLKKYQISFRFTDL